MFYEAIIFSKDKKDWHWHYGSRLPGIIPDRVLKMSELEFADNVLGLCDKCPLQYYPHPMRPDGSKFCTVLFHDLVQPSWELSDVGADLKNHRR